jgi:hypothetical protein
MPYGPDLVFKDACVEIVGPRNEVTEKAVSPGRKPARFKNRPGPEGAHTPQRKGADAFGPLVMRERRRLR